MSRFDIELLFIFDEIYKTRNVTRAAENLGLPQSTVSIGLGKLRTHFNDRLFARTSKGMEPTPRAQNAVQDVRAAIAAWQHALADQPVFEPAASTREFAICMTDISEIVLLPTLLNHLQQVGPGITLDVSKIATDTPERLEGGEVMIQPKRFANTASRSPPTSLMASTSFLSMASIALIATACNAVAWAWNALKLAL